MVQGASGDPSGDVATMGLPLTSVVRGVGLALVRLLDGFCRQTVEQ
jgi:hypothetical protein